MNNSQLDRCSQASAALTSDWNALGTSAPFGSASATSSASESLQSTGRKCPASTTLPTSEQMSLPLMSSLQDSHASQSASPVSGSPKTMNAGSGPMWTDSFAFYDPESSSWKTSQGSLVPDSMTSSVGWPRAGTTRNGTAYRLAPSAPLTVVTGCSWLPTPQATDNRNRGSSDAYLSRRKRLGKQLMLSMLWRLAPCVSCVESMMGFPIGWTHCEVSGTRSCRKSRNTLGTPSLKRGECDD